MLRGWFIPVFSAIYYLGPIYLVHNDFSWVCQKNWILLKGLRVKVQGGVHWFKIPTLIGNYCVLWPCEMKSLNSDGTLYISTLDPSIISHYPLQCPFITFLWILRKIDLRSLGLNFYHHQLVLQRASHIALTPLKGNPKFPNLQKVKGVPFF